MSRRSAETSFSLDCLNAPSSDIPQCSVSRTPVDLTRTLDDALPPAGGVTHLAGTPIKSFIVWRLLGHRHVLELRRIFMASAPAIGDSAVEQVPDPKYSNKPVHIHLPGPALQTPSIGLDATGRNLHIMLVTATGVFVRVIFEGPNFFYAEGWRRRRIHRYQIRALLPNRNNGAVIKPVLVQFPGLNDFIVGCSNGTVVKVTCLVPGEDSEDDEGDIGDAESSSSLRYTELKLAEEGVINQLMQAFTPTKWFSPFKSSAKTPAAAEPLDDPRQPIAMNSVRHFGFSLCRDRQIRVWNLKKENKWATINVASDYSKLSSDVVATGTPPLADPRTGHFIQIFDEQSYEDGEEFDISDHEFKAAVYVAPYDDTLGGFAIYKGRIDRFGDLQEFEIISYEDTAGIDHSLVDFMVIPRAEAPRDVAGAVDDVEGWILWALWRQSDGTTAVSRTRLRIMDPSSATRYGRSQWTLLIQEYPAAPPYVPDASSGESVAKAFGDHITGRFPTQIQAAALADYRDAGGAMFLDTLEESGTPASLMEEVSHSVQSAVEHNASTSAVNEWQQYLSTCQALYNRYLAPAAIDWDPSYDSILITKRGFLAVVRDCETAEILREWRNHHSDVPPPSELYDNAALSRFDDPDAKVHFAAFLSLSDWVAERFHAKNLPAIDQCINNMIFGKTPAEFLAAAKKLISDIFALSTSDGDDEGLAEFTTRYSQIPPTFFTSLITVLTSLDSDLAQNSSASQRPNTSGFTNSLVAFAFAQVVHARCRLMSDVMLVQLFANHIATPEDRHVQDAQVSSTYDALRILSVAQWIADQSVYVKQAVTSSQVRATSPASQAPTSTLTGRFKSLDLSMPEQPRAISGPEDATEPLAFHLLQQQYLLDIDFASESHGNYGLLLKLAVSSLAKRLGLFCTSAVGSDDPLASPLLLKLAVKLLAFQHVDAANKLVAMLPECPAVFYLRARAATDLGKWDAAERDFDRASVELDKNGVAPDASLSHVLDQGIIVGGVTAYDQHLVHLFSRRDCPRLVVKYTSRAVVAVEQQPASPERTRQLAKLYNESFRYNLRLADFDAAYTAVVRNPDPQVRINCLRLLIGSMCEAGEIEGLCGRFAFNALQEDVELELLNKIRTTHIGDCLTADMPNYYRIHHAYSVSRDDYRTAAATMYLYARKIDAELLSVPHSSRGTQPQSVKPIAALQELCAAYLASLNALMSVDKEYAYVLVPATGHNGATRKRRCLDVTDDNGSRITAQLPPQSQRIVRAMDIRGEYLLALAKLNLSTSGSASHAATISLTPPDALALLTSVSRFDDAFTLGKHFDLDLARTFEAMAEKCVWLAKRALTTAVSGSNSTSVLSGAPGGAEDLTDDPDLAWTGSDTARAWRLMCGHLDRLDDAGTYRAAVIDRVLFVDPLHPLPLGLTTFYQTHHPEDLLRLYVKYDRLDDAARFFTDSLTLQHDRRIQTPLATPARSRIPHTLADELLARLEPARAAALRNAIRRYLEDVAEDSRKAASVAARKHVTPAAGRRRGGPQPQQQFQQQQQQQQQRQQQQQQQQQPPPAFGNSLFA
ncbi:hypothetical protein HDU87_000182 [Geranomyces variabilis]|uniref:Nucleoporin Nup120/160-domain-containing protein n=1 Tax=Geranomyces variabilis TaxID=109894 RepID=A0AAD5TS56_9FUNG|nr:hypothetical protein HDU87_000182 [Geranomyces variabilis]